MRACPRVCRSRWAAVAGVALALAFAPRSAAAYPTSTVFAPSGEALPFGSISLYGYAGVNVAPAVSFSSATGGVTFGVAPSFDILPTPAGKLAFGGVEVGLDFGANGDGIPLAYINVKVQLFKEAKYWPATSIGIFQLSPDAERNTFLGYFAASKTFTYNEVYLGQASLGMMTSFGNSAYVAPHCLVSGATSCLFRGSAPFEDENAALLIGYFSPWLGPFGLGIDYVGGTSDVSSANVLLTFRLWSDNKGGIAILGLGGYLGLDRRPVPPGPGSTDGLFLQFAMATTLSQLIGFDPTKEWSRPPLQNRGRGVRPEEDPFDAVPLKPAVVTETVPAKTVKTP